MTHAHVDPEKNISSVMDNALTLCLLGQASNEAN